MEKVLRPERLDADPNTATAAQEWLHWKITFTKFFDSLPQDRMIFLCLSILCLYQFY